MKDGDRLKKTDSEGIPGGGRLEIRGVGVSEMSGDEMVEGNRGVGVRLRHKVRK